MKILIISFLFFGVFQFTYGQPGLPPSTTNTRPLTPKEINDRDFEIRRRAMQELTNPLLKQQVRTTDAVKSLKKEEKERRKKILTPNSAHLLKYKNFLRQPKTGIFRLFPDFDCETRYIVRTDGECANFVPLGWTYSFRENDYSNTHLHDIGFKRDFLVSESMLAQGIFVSLGDTSLNELSLTSDGLKYLVDFMPETDRQLVKKQFNGIVKGIEHNGYFYSNKIKPEENVTYALRVVAYKYKDKDGFRFRRETTSSEEFDFIRLKYSERKDVLIVFRIIEKSSDGGITILWKELQRRDSPTIIFQKEEKLRDIISNNKYISSN